MDRDIELDLIHQIFSLKAATPLFLDKAESRNPITHYTCPERFSQECDAIFIKHPYALAHTSEMSGFGDFLRRDIFDRSVLLTRDKEGQVHAFLNVCRHRGTRLVSEVAGCKHRFSCPYHAWTYSNKGELIAAPHFEAGFPNMDKADLGLVRLACQERFGFIWVTAEHTATMNHDGHFAPLAEDLEGLEIENLRIADETTQIRAANWKTLVEGGIESYHFRIAHSKTIGSYFEDNLSTYQMFGPHIRSILPRTSLSLLQDKPESEWRLRDHANILYTLFPTCQFLVQQDHIVWIQSEPLSVNETRLRLVTLVPKDSNQPEAYWRRNHDITLTTLNEDFDIGESIQQSARLNANKYNLFGRFEGALHCFNQVVEGHLS